MAPVPEHRLFIYAVRTGRTSTESRRVTFTNALYRPVMRPFAQEAKAGRESKCSLTHGVPVPGLIHYLLNYLGVKDLHQLWLFVHPL